MLSTCRSGTAIEKEILGIAASGVARVTLGTQKRSLLCLPACEPVRPGPTEARQLPSSRQHGPSFTDKPIAAPRGDRLHPVHASLQVEGRARRPAVDDLLNVLPRPNFDTLRGCWRRPGYRNENHAGSREPEHVADNTFVHELFPLT